ncbi:hydantoinase/oxoprolinase family protein [Shimia sp. R11_0]|uniref:hydantoinase/oxoprolinase N-terminal domain-containing protein n=1 Tax=Shimia sp. R11_0 TaxID=2821096 RepID=UPI001ADAF4E4|nr:hydantoinase/oxoprolinase family protein [Shimia sp. R11_0]MBO9476312.1 hydantoinase/oxoprolinase family protein [Shimia sp. R11_0]
MSLSLGVDTGGTYTDAVLIRNEQDVIASAKSLTTRDDLAKGIGAAVESVLQQAAVRPEEITLASLSTTLATNALVEGQGERVGLILIGFQEEDLHKHGLAEALAGDPHVVVAGGHNHAGHAEKDLDEVALCAWLETVSDVSGFAIAGKFATRNPAHEQRAAEFVAARLNRPISASHQLSAKLNGPKRALTALLNARLIGMIDRLISRADHRLRGLGITAPLMVVRGDGALISAELAREKPIETILSGPAASIVGARWLTGAEEALVSDIGGTTTDVAVLRNGQPAIDPQGARVGAFRTMVEAVAMHTFGLGGDSEVQVQSSGLQGGVTLGPRRVLPVALLATEAPEVVHEALETQLRRAVPMQHDGRFVRAVTHLEPQGLTAREATLFERIGAGVRPLGEVLKNQLEKKALDRLVARGLVQQGGVTPSDASHVLGNADFWDQEAATLALSLMARNRIGSGQTLAAGPEALAQMIVAQLTHQTSLALLETAFAEEDSDFGLSPAQLARHVLTQRGLTDGHKGLVRIDTGLVGPVIGLGASARQYYPAVGARVRCDTILPVHGGVANAIGAVVGRITIRKSGTVTAPSEGKFRVHLDAGPEDYSDENEALIRLETALTQQAEEDALRSGAEGIRVTVHKDIRRAQAEAREVFVEASFTVEASGRPRIAEA